ncbi:MAG: alpha-L-arabinofuranosidase [Limisphaerales bacterium]
MKLRHGVESFPLRQLDREGLGGYTIIMKVQPMLPALLAAWLLTLSPSLLAQASLPVYTDNMVNGFQDRSWMPHNLASTSLVHSGANSISATPSAVWQALAFAATIYNSYEGGFNNTPYNNFVFWANGGPAEGQVLEIFAYYDGEENSGNAYVLPPLTNSWQQYSIPLSYLLPVGVSNLYQINIQITPYGRSTATFYVDDVSFSARPAPALEHLSVDASQALRTADPRWFGVNTGVWDAYLDSSATSNALSQAGILSLRFPGGSLSDQYDWATGLATVWSNEVPISTYSYPSIFANFMHIATNLGEQAFITVNYGSGTSNEAAAWVLDANVTNKCHLQYWEVGNEVYGNWEQDTNIPPNDPYTYAVRFAGYQALMKAADPSIKVGAVSTPGEDGYNTYTNHPATNSVTHRVHNGWTPVMLATMKSLGVTPDFLIYHFYPEYTPYENPVPVVDSDPLVLQVSSQVAGDAANLRMMITDYLGPGGTNTELVCTEDNSDAGAEGRQSTSLVNALYVADTLGQFMKTEFNAYTFWQLRGGPGNTGSFDPTFYGWRDTGDEGLIEGLDNGLESSYPDYYAMQLMQYFVRPGDTVLNANSDYLLLSDYAARGADGSLRLLVINKDTEAAFNSQISLTNFVPSPSATVYSYGIPQDDATEYDLSEAFQEIAVSNYPSASTLFTYSFPPLSLTVFNFAPAAPSLKALPSASGQFAFQLDGQSMTPYIIQTSTNLVTWTSVSTNLLAGASLYITNTIPFGTSNEYWRAIWTPSHRAEDCGRDLH